MGLYECSADQGWGRFAFDAATGRITNTQLTTLCVNGGGAPLPLPTAAQLAWLDAEVSLMISYGALGGLVSVRVLPPVADGAGKANTVAGFCVHGASPPSERRPSLTRTPLSYQT